MGSRPDDGRGHVVRASGALQARRGQLEQEESLVRSRSMRARSRHRDTPRQSRGERVATAHSGGAAVPGIRSAERAGARRSNGVQRGGDRGGASGARRAVRRGAARDRLRELGGGWTLASDPAAEDAARRLFSRRRVATLTPAQAETLAIVAYLQPISRPEITRIRGVSADSAAATLLERGLIGQGRPLPVWRRSVPRRHPVPEAVRGADARSCPMPPTGSRPGGAGDAARAVAASRRGQGGERRPAE